MGVLPVCLNVVFLSLPRSLTAASFRSLCSHKRSWQNHIPSSRSFSCNRLSGNKKSRHTNAYRLTAKRINLSLAVVASHSCNRLWNSKSKLSFTLICCRQSKAVSEAAAFSLSIPQALSGSQPSSQICEERYSVVALFWYFFIIHHRTNVCQYFLNKFLNIFQKSGDTILFYALRSEIETDSHFIMSLKPLITTYKNRKLEVEKAWFQAISKA